MGKIINLNVDGLGWDIEVVGGKFYLILSVDDKNYIVDKFDTKFKALANFNNTLDEFIDGKVEFLIVSGDEFLKEYIDGRSWKR